MTTYIGCHSVKDEPYVRTQMRTTSDFTHWLAVTIEDTEITWFFENRVGLVNAGAKLLADLSQKFEMLNAPLDPPGPDDKRYEHYLDAVF